MVMRVECVPQLGCDEELLPLDDGWNDLLERTADLVLVLVDHRKVEMAISVAHGDLNLHTKSSEAYSDTSINEPTAFSTSFGFDSHVPSPIWGIVCPVDRERTLPYDMGEDQGLFVAGGVMRGPRDCAYPSPSAGIIYHLLPVRVLP